MASRNAAMQGRATRIASARPLQLVRPARRVCVPPKAFFSNLLQLLKPSEEAVSPALEEPVEEVIIDPRREVVDKLLSCIDKAGDRGEAGAYEEILALVDELRQMSVPETSSVGPELSATWKLLFTTEKV